MKTTVVSIPTDRISDWDSFRGVFAAVLGFPGFYGQNMNAWIDCLWSADAPADGMVAQAVEPGELLTLRLDKAGSFADRCPEQFKALIECTALVNDGRIEKGLPPVLALLLAGDLA